METNRFQRWLVKKNASTELKEPLADQNEKALRIGSSSSSKEECFEAIEAAKLEQDIEPQPVNETPQCHNNDEAQQQHKTTPNLKADENISLATVAHVFEEGFSKVDKKQQLRDLFHGGLFSDVDPLDSYNLNYHLVKSLPKDVALTLRQWHQKAESMLEDEPRADSRSETVNGDQDSDQDSDQDNHQDNQQEVSPPLESEDSELEEHIDIKEEEKR